MKQFFSYQVIVRVTARVSTRAFIRFTSGILVAILMVFPAGAQRQTQDISQLWLGYFNQTRFSQKWGIWTDIHLRTREDVFTGLSQAIIRAGLTYYLKDDVKFTGGYAYINHFPAENHKNVSQPEHRPWQQLQWHTRYSRLRLMQWIRVEERFRRKILNDDVLGKGYNFNFRVRYNFFSMLPLSRKHFRPKTFSLVLNDEVHVNFGKEIVYNYFDQNRFFAGVAYHLNNHDNIQLGYMNIFQQLTAGNRYRSTHVARLFYFHNLDLAHKK